MGQAKQKKQLTIADYHLWSTMNLSTISGKGLWVGYSLRYDSGLDTLFVSSSDGKKKFIYPKGRKAKFFGDRWFACITGKNSLTLTTLETGKREVMEGVSDYEFSANGKHFVIFSKDSNGKKAMTIRNLFSSTSEIVGNISSWSFNNDRSVLAYDVKNETGSEVIILSLQDIPKLLAQLPFSGYVAANIVWQENGDSLLFVLRSLQDPADENLSQTKLAYFRCSDLKLFVLEPEKTDGFPKGKHIHSIFSNDLCISEDGKRVLFQLLPDSLTQKYIDPTVEIWHGDDKRIYTERKLTGTLDEWAKAAVWYPDASTIFEIMPQETHVMLSGNQQFALSSNLESCEPQLEYTAKRNYYLTNLITQERKLWMACHSGEIQHTFMSPSGNYIAYFKDGNWFAYNIVKNIHINLTSSMNIAFYDETNDIPDKPDAYGLAGWTASDQSIFLYDQFDVWEVATDGSSLKRLTHGREKGICFRITKSNKTLNSQGFLSVTPPEVIDLKTPLLLQATTLNKEQQGFFTLEGDFEKPLVFSSHRIEALLKADQADVYAYIQEDYENPPSLQIKKGKNGKPHCLFQSNPHHKEYHWGKAAVISYVTPTGEKLKGLLYYPSGYKKGGVYPMIVYIYEKQVKRFKEYMNPTVYLTDGFNVTNFVTDGYFVLLPDISYTIGKPGDSALDCVTAAVNTVLDLGVVNPTKIGLQGHSFGGYETSYILTKSKLFATAVAGSAQTNLISGYLDVSENYKKAEFWRYESYTNRMDKPLFEDISGYIYNSPVFKSQSIVTPLLLWTGDHDTQVAPSQSMELYLAMRRLGKKVTMLRYPNENHTLAEPTKQADLTQKIVDWFGHYLKDSPPKQWMLANDNP